MNGLKRLSGSKRQKHLHQVKKLAIHRHEVQDVNLESSCDYLLREVAELTNNVGRLSEHKRSFTKLSDENKELQEYVQTLLEKERCSHCDSTYTNKGATYDKVSYTQKRRKLKELKTDSEQALWFLETFGFKIDKLSLTDSSAWR